jgi:sorting nexin-29
MVCLLFTITLEYANRKSDTQTRGTIFYKSVQLIAYADDIVIIGRSSASMKEASQLLAEATKEVN